MNNDGTEDKNRRTGWLFSVVFHTAIIFLMAFFGLSWQTPPPEPGGILVNLGIPDVGQGDENAPEGNPPPPVEETKPDPVEETAPPEESVPEPVKETKPTPTPEKEVKKTEDPNAVALRKKQEEAKKKAEAEAKAKAAEERKKKEAAEKARAEAAAKKAEEDRKRKELEAMVSGGLGGGKGDGKGNTGTSGNQGDPNGDPNAGALSGISTGSGTVGGGLSGRGYQRPTPPKDNSQATGVVVVYVCVDKNGNVISAEYTQSGSTTADSNLKKIAIANAKKYKFDKGGVDKQCGTIRYDFKVK